ncbi:Carbon catabolite repressor protein 4, putative isoform 1 [Theobroma cacao]|uniref:poly(A)-specific ribonuclease n=1 Tax=Theobroma cacao TaxID=3641 RepID=A0A061FGH0_THECC|nr:Carbon catabolite repressor protein 4, putative isoform 1 [Theobroma cacao]
MGSQDSKEYEMAVTLPSNTPVEGCEINPDVRVKHRAFPTLQPLPPYSVTFSWYREVVCSVHPSKLATVQCMSCVKLEVPVDQSYHCSSQCFLDAWQMHVKLHSHAVKTEKQTATGGQQELRMLRSCGSWPDFSADQLFGENTLVVEREGKVWIKVGSSKTYKPSKEDVGFTLRLECVAVDYFEGTQLAPINIIVTDPVITFPPRCPRCMIEVGSYMKSHNIHFKSQTSDGLTFSVLSYNILADMYTGMGKYSYCPSWAVVWEYRKQNLLQEIIGYDADIICLQEVQSDHFEGYLQPELMKCGYSVMYKRKRTELYTSSRHYISEGCATFYRHDLFKEIMKYELEFDQRAQLVVEDLKPELKHVGRIRLMKDNVALIVILEAIRDGSTNDDFQFRICVANTHTHANTELPDVKLYQVANLVRGLEKIAQSKIPLLICGDLNSPPESDPHMLLVRGRINSVSGERTDPLGIYQILKLEHSLALVSAYASFFHLRGIDEKQFNRMNLENHEPLFTYFTSGFAGTLDYILYTADSLRVEGLLELLDFESMGVGLPSPLWSSDHIALMASFRLKPHSTSESWPALPQEI